MIDSARHYENEAQVGIGLRQSGVKREDIFISEFMPGNPSPI
jgi:diketogulonate reductase-like aldo/keto reductase